MPMAKFITTQSILWTTVITSVALVASDVLGWLPINTSNSINRYRKKWN